LHWPGQRCVEAAAGSSLFVEMLVRVVGAGAAASADQHFVLQFIEAGAALANSFCDVVFGDSVAKTDDHE